MKNIFIIALATIVFTLTFSACNEFLGENPVVFYSEESVFATEEGVETAVNGMYASLSSGAYYGTSWHNLIMPHSGKFFSTQVANRDVTGLNATSSNTWINDLWSQAYQTINVANTLIENLENTTVSLNNRETALGNAYFLRGVAYFDLVNLFGGVPLRSTPTTIDNIHLPRASKEAVIQQIIADWKKAETMMPEPGNTTNARPSRLAANVCLAKLYMVLAGGDNGNPAYWEKAKTELLPVINSGAFRLAPTYAELFTPGNENTVESIFEIQYGHTGGIRNSDIVRSFTPSNSLFAPANAVTFGRLRPNKETFDQHVAQYPGDPRIAATFLFGQYERLDGVIQKIYPDKKTGNTGFPYIRKWFDPGYNGTTTERNLILLRYADVLLMMAEIENEISGPDNAYSFVNQVLTRARDTNGDGISDAAQPADWSNMTKDDFRLRIMQERYSELLSEGQDWLDSRRRGFDFFLQEIVAKHNGHTYFDATTDFVYPMSDKNKLLPIPLSEISGNQAISNSDQNPGY